MMGGWEKKDQVQIIGEWVVHRQKTQRVTSNSILIQRVVQIMIIVEEQQMTLLGRMEMVSSETMIFYDPQFLA